MSVFAGVRWVFFDVGDTLLDERDMVADEARQVSKMLAARGIERSADDFLRTRERVFTMKTPNVFATIGDVLGVPAELWVDCRDRVSLRLDLQRPFPGVTDALARLSQCCRVGVIANQPRGTLQRMRDHGWGEIVRVCVSSTEEGMHKPDPEMFRIALRRAECAAREAVMVGDRIDNDVRPAKSLGMRTIRVVQGAARGQSPLDAVETPDATVDSVPRAVDLLLQPS